MQKAEQGSFKIRNRIWIEGESGTFLGNGRVSLLEIISKTGSINKAAKELKMSYRKAWSMLESMNSQSAQPLIIKSAGGDGGGGTIVTDEGLKAIAQFKTLDNKCREFLNKELENMEFQ
ncbi:MAG: LysR family transcriptional regulator [Vicingaceae bacterium]